jgi:hypothetical protein
MALVLEDDVIPESDQWLYQLEAVSEALLHHACSGAAFICHLGARSDQIDAAIKREVLWSEGIAPEAMPRVFLHADPGRNLWRAHAYLISRAAAERGIKREKKIRTLADDWERRRRLRLYDELLFTQPTLFGQDEQTISTIDPKRERAIPAMPTATSRNWPMRAVRSISYRVRFLIARKTSNRPYVISSFKGG